MFIEHKEGMHVGWGLAISYSMQRHIIKFMNKDENNIRLTPNFLAAFKLSKVIWWEVKEAVSSHSDSKREVDGVANSWLKRHGEKKKISSVSAGFHRTLRTQE